MGTEAGTNKRLDRGSVAGAGACADAATSRDAADSPLAGPSSGAGVGRSPNAADNDGEDEEAGGGMRRVFMSTNLGGLSRYNNRPKVGLKGGHQWGKAAGRAPQPAQSAGRFRLHNRAVRCGLTAPQPPRHAIRRFLDSLFQNDWSLPMIRAASITGGFLMPHTVRARPSVLNCWGSSTVR